MFKNKTFFLVAFCFLVHGAVLSALPTVTQNGGPPLVTIPTQNPIATASFLVFVTGAPATDPGTWVGLYTTANLSTYLSWTYLNNSHTEPSSGTSMALVNLTAPAAGQYVIVLHSGTGAWITTSSDFPVAAIAPPSVQPTTPYPVAGGQLVVNVSSGNGSDPAEWVGLYQSPSGNLVSWLYLNGSQTEPSSGTVAATLSFTTPLSGFYYLELHTTGAKLATSEILQPEAPPAAGISVGTPAPAAGGQVPITVTTGNATDNAMWVGLYAAGASGTNYISWQYLNGLQSTPAYGTDRANLNFYVLHTGQYYFTLNSHGAVIASTPVFTAGFPYGQNCPAGFTLYGGVYNTPCAGTNTCWSPTSAGLSGGVDATIYGASGWQVQCTSDQMQIQNLCPAGFTMYHQTSNTPCGMNTCWSPQSAHAPGGIDATNYGNSGWNVQCPANQAQLTHVPVCPSGTASFYGTLYGTSCQTGTCWAPTSGAYPNGFALGRLFGYEYSYVQCPIGDTQLPAGGSCPDCLSSTARTIDYFGGDVMEKTPNVYFIWYGTWTGDPAPQILNDLVSSLGGSSYWNTLSTYSDLTGNSAATSINYGGSIQDNYSLGNSFSDSSFIYTVVANATNPNSPVHSNGTESGVLPSDPNGIYVVLSSQDVTYQRSQSCSGYHTQVGGLNIIWLGTGNCPGATQFGSVTINGNSRADKLADNLAHELAETVTDPLPQTAWYGGPGDFEDGEGEVGDRCTADYGAVQRAPSGAVFNVSLGARKFLLQQLWVNVNGGSCVMRYP